MPVNREVSPWLMGHGTWREVQRRLAGRGVSLKLSCEGGWPVLQAEGPEWFRAHPSSEYASSVYTSLLECVPVPDGDLDHLTNVVHAEYLKWRAKHM